MPWAFQYDDVGGILQQSSIGMLQNSLHGANTGKCLQYVCVDSLIPTLSVILIFALAIKDPNSLLHDLVSMNSVS